ncbi:MAG: alpha/beta fold hydrolase [Prevotella sp.]|nr:alpha/beta fold hydrolase [Prevotella sp.]
MRKLTLFVLLLTALAAKAQFGPVADEDTKYATELIKPGTVAPDFKMKTIDGKTFKLSQLKGKTVVLDFWASWCPDCRKDAPEVVRMHRKFRSQGVEFVGVSMDTDVAQWRAAVEKYGIEYTQVSELKKFKETDISKAYGVKWIPSMVVIGPDGKVALSTVLSYKVDKYLRELSPRPFTRDTEAVTIDGDHGKLAAIIQKPVVTPHQSPLTQFPIVVLCHGFGGTKSGQMFDLICDSLAAHGIGSIRFDFNGHGQSEGKFEDMTVPNEMEDAKHVIAYVRDLRWVSKIALLGHSQGGVVSAMTAGELADDISAVVLMAPAAVLRDDAIRGSTFGKQYDPLDPPEYVDLWGGQRLGAGYIRTAFRLPIYETAARYHGPACVIHGTGDRVVPYTYGLRFHQQWPASEYDELEAYDHGFSQNVYRATELASDFLIKTLK